MITKAVITIEEGKEESGKVQVTPAVQAIPHDVAIDFFATSITL